MDDDPELFLSRDEMIRIEALKAAVNIEPEEPQPFSFSEADRRKNRFWNRVESFENYIRNGKES